MRSLTILAGAVVVVSMLASAPARADASTAKAKQLYDEGVTNYNLGHFEEALTAFDMAYRIRHDAAFLFNIAQCQRNLKRYEDAQRTFRAYLRESPDLPPATREQVQKLIAEMEKAIDEQRTKVPPTGTQAPGTNQPAETQTVPAAPAPTMTQPAPPQAIAPTSSSADHNRTLRKVGIGLLIAGVAVAGVGGGLAGYSSSLYSQAKNATVLGDQRDLKNRSDVMNEAAWPLVGVGCAAIVGGAVTLALSFRTAHAETRAMVQR